MHPPIDPKSPVPEHCDPKKTKKGSGPKKQTSEFMGFQPNPESKGKKHEEL